MRSKSDAIKVGNHLFNESDVVVIIFIGGKVT